MSHLVLFHVCDSMQMFGLAFSIHCLHRTQTKSCHRSLGLGHFSQQLISYVFETNLADMMRIQDACTIHKASKMKNFEFRHQSDV